MGLFTKKPGGTFLGNAFRGIGKIVNNVIAGQTGINLGIGAGDLGKIEKGQKYTNGQIKNNPELYIPPGESVTVAQLRVNPALAVNKSSLDAIGLTPQGNQVAVEGNFLDKVGNFFGNLFSGAQSAKDAADQAKKSSEIFKWVLIALGGFLVVMTVLKMRKK